LSAISGYFPLAISVRLISVSFPATSQNVYSSYWRVFLGTKTMNHLLTTLEIALRSSIDHLENLDKQPVAPTADYTQLRRQLGKPLADQGMAPEQVVSDLARDVEGGIMGSGSGRFFCWVIGGALPSAVAADWLAAAWDQNAGMYATSPAAAIVEEVAGVWLKDILGLPEQASFALVTGCQMAHVTCLAAARHHLLEQRGWNVEERGLSGSPTIRILASDQRHGSVDRAVRLLGLGTANMEYLATDSQGVGGTSVGSGHRVSPGRRNQYWIV
jgi:aromatic-L-amino-acid decarboxylase